MLPSCRRASFRLKGLEPAARIAYQVLMEEPSARTSRLALAGVVAAALVVGGVGFLLGRNTAEPAQIVVAPPTPAPEPSRAAGPKSKEQKRVEAEARARTKALRDRIATIERELEEVGAELAELQERFASPDFYMSGVDVAEVTRLYEAGKKRLENLESVWASAVEELESASG